jgi:hypothetical protein
MGLHQLEASAHQMKQIPERRASLGMGENLCHYSSDKGLIFRIYKELRKVNTKRLNNSINN